MDCGTVARKEQIWLDLEVGFYTMGMEGLRGHFPNVLKVSYFHVDRSVCDGRLFHLREGRLTRHLRRSRLRSKTVILTVAPYAPIHETLHLIVRWLTRHTWKDDLSSVKSNVGYIVTRN